MNPATHPLQEVTRLRLLAAALELQHLTSTAANLVPIPGGERVIVIGTRAEVARLMEVAPAAPTQAAPSEQDEKALSKRLRDCIAQNVVPYPKDVLAAAEVIERAAQGASGAPTEPKAWLYREYDDQEKCHSKVWKVTLNRADMELYKRYNAIIEPLGSLAAPSGASGAQGEPVRYELRMRAPNGHCGPWCEVADATFERFSSNPDIGDGFTYEARTLGILAAHPAPSAAPVQRTRDWPEDYASGENQYECKCSTCGSPFFGHKRRVTCKVCAAHPAPSAAPAADPMMDSMCEPPYGQPDLYARLVRFCRQELPLAQQQGKVKAWVTAALSVAPYEATKFGYGAPVAPSQTEQAEAPSGLLVCATCGADRSSAPCGNPSNCGMIGVAHQASAQSEGDAS